MLTWLITIIRDIYTLVTTGQPNGGNVAAATAVGSVISGSFNISQSTLRDPTSTAPTLPNILPLPISTSPGEPVPTLPPNIIPTSPGEPIPTPPPPGATPSASPLPLQNPPIPSSAAPLLQFSSTAPVAIPTSSAPPAPPSCYNVVTLFTEADSAGAAYEVCGQVEVCYTLPTNQQYNTVSVTLGYALSCELYADSGCTGQNYALNEGTSAASDLSTVEFANTLVSLVCFGFPLDAP
ncbi:uncharacterized protein LY89DRAFT_281723 [Mollisia scopiformis]|uniref:Uncharacterized protein n=1 Tax=Mollisia scopiformis TaxID=149040 RepID=A0A132BB72_MOLSC|nr:uncharacterized protein LY89DRAFT_281723 [Mollisia scopiformis]KUJ09249.1 hypothetical protein LY89DRAFT_281723 [Mollisia scopiformis]